MSGEQDFRKVITLPPEFGDWLRKQVSGDFSKLDFIVDRFSEGGQELFIRDHKDNIEHVRDARLTAEKNLGKRNLPDSKYW